jgi:hypothetical protein
MTKGQGYASIGAILLAGVMFRGSLSSDPSRGSDRLRESTLASAEKSATGEGPWLASCRYWAAVRSAQPAAAKTAPQLNIKLTQTDTSFGATVNGSLEPAKTACERAGDGWGIPDKASKPKPEIHAIIVAVPDPIHSHLALEFDRSIDSLMQAAADYRFLGSSYWLPWRNPSSTVPVAQPTAPDPNRGAHARGTTRSDHSEIQPSRQRTVRGDDQLLPGRLSLLVGESPALGIDGTQLRNALDYEKNLRDTHDAALSMEAPPGQSSDIPYTPGLHRPTLLRFGHLAATGPAISGVYEASRKDHRSRNYFNGDLPVGAQRQIRTIPTSNHLSLLRRRHKV